MASSPTTALAGNFAKDSWQELALNPSVEVGVPGTRKSAINATLAFLQTTLLVERPLLHLKEQLRARPTRTGRRKAREARVESPRVKVERAQAELRLLTPCQMLIPVFTPVKSR